MLNTEIINIHPSYLPYGRGIYPILWAIYKNQPHGYSIHKINEGIDTGPVYFRKVIKFDSDFTLRQARVYLMLSATKLLIKNFHKIVENSIDPMNQNQLTFQVKYNNRIKSIKLLEKINFNWDLTIKDVIQILNS